MAAFEEWCVLNHAPKEDISVVRAEMRRAFNAEPQRLRKGPGGERQRGWSGVRWTPGEEPRPRNLLAGINQVQSQMVEKCQAENQRLRERLELFEPRQPRPPVLAGPVPPLVREAAPGLAETDGVAVEEIEALIRKLAEEPDGPEPAGAARGDGTAKES
jgi:hypothetical protein